ncbi:hypothetical protein Nepgr_007473 [Nepenthes gracilis]|uniref:Uncharacterized protein n=1 Tax=Nepenthes gracilis TaxID=150966 RepID=A0AAD3S727_NEPGR|nr:hypothetical protein Nepgr_007473 [Nepenthes gracilis]
MASKQVAVFLLIAAMALIMMSSSIEEVEAYTDEACYEGCIANCMAVEGATVPICRAQCLPICEYSESRRPG